MTQEVGIEVCIREVCRGKAARSRLPGQSVWGRWGQHLQRPLQRHLRLSCLGLGLGLVVVGLVLAGERGVAQTPSPGPLRLTVRPHQMATGTQSPPAGLYPVDSLAGYWTYVPEPCAGARRCPLVLFLHPGSTSAWFPIRRWSPVADKYGMILLAPNCLGSCDRADRAGIDAAMTQILRQYAIDPDKIAVIGYSGSADGSLELGVDNPDVFNRVVPLSGLGVDNSTHEILKRLDPKNTTVEFRLDEGWSDQYQQRHYIEIAQTLRQGGHPVKHVVGFRNHGYQWEFFDALGRWLQESWAIPDPAARPVPPLVVDSLPLLTDSALVKLHAFWTRFLEEPDSIRITGRRAHLREVTIPVGAERPSVVMVDMAALAAAYPAVAAALQAAGLTAQEHDAYRAALFSARVAMKVGQIGYENEGLEVLGPAATDENSALVKNVDFLKEEGNTYLRGPLGDYEGTKRRMMFIP